MKKYKSPIIEDDIRIRIRVSREQTGINVRIKTKSPRPITFDFHDPVLNLK
jgi:hypothetical protein